MKGFRKFLALTALWPNVRILSLIVFSLPMAGCAPSPLLKYGMQTPAATLVPVRYAGMSDGRARFREIFCAVQKDHGHLLPDDRPCEQALHRLADEPAPEGRAVRLGRARLPMRLVIIPGLSSECVSGFIQPFTDARPHVESYGYRTGIIMVSGLAASSRNADQIRDIVAGMNLPPEERLVFIGYSKGTPDVLEAVARHPDLGSRTAAVVTLAGVVAGTPIADDISEFLKQFADQSFEGRCAPGEGKAFDSLRRADRLTWLSENRLPASVRYFSLAAFTDRENISLVLRSGYDKLALVDPRNDSQVVAYDALVPGGTLLGYLNADHWAVAMPFNREHPVWAETLITRNAYPREVLLESIARVVEESLMERPDH